MAERQSDFHGKYFIIINFLYLFIVMTFVCLTILVFVSRKDEDTRWDCVVKLPPLRLIYGYILNEDSALGAREIKLQLLVWDVEEI